MPFYTVTHNHSRGISSFIIECDKALNLDASYFDADEPGDDNTLLQSLIARLAIRFEPERHESIEINEALPSCITTVTLAELTGTADTAPPQKITPEPEAPATVLYDDLYGYACGLEDEWEANEGLDWDQAEHLVELIKTIAPLHLTKLPTLQSLLDYTDENDEWDSGEVANFPATVTKALEESDYQYSYRPDGNSWEVFKVNLSGLEDWIATVDTETIAHTLIDQLA